MTKERMIAEEFGDKIDLYKDYGLAVSNLLESLLRRGHFKYQLSQRIKSSESIREKIKRKKSTGKIYKHLNDLEDIVGIRIIFYIESDRKKFIKVLLKALKGTVRLEKNIKNSGYESVHAIVMFDKRRTNLDEYKKFKKLKCEVQMTLILNHAWAEVEHDIFYKENPNTKPIDRKSYQSLKERMKRLMCDHIQKATLGLENIIHNINKMRTFGNKSSIRS